MFNSKSTSCQTRSPAGRRARAEELRDKASRGPLRGECVIDGQTSKESVKIRDTRSNAAALPLLLLLRTAITMENAYSNAAADGPPGETNEVSKTVTKKPRRTLKPARKGARVASDHHEEKHMVLKLVHFRLHKRGCSAAAAPESSHHQEGSLERGCSSPRHHLDQKQVGENLIGMRDKKGVFSASTHEGHQKEL